MANSSNKELKAKYLSIGIDEKTLLNEPSLKLLEESFPGIKDTINYCAKLGFPWESGRLFIKEGLSHVGFFECPILIENKWHKIGALHAICTKSTHRNQGLASQLIKEALKWGESRCECVILFTDIPEFYEKLSFQKVQEYRFHLDCKHAKGSKALTPMVAPKDDPLSLNCFKNREPLSNCLWIKDTGLISSFNALFTSYPIYWSLYYSPAIDGLICWVLEDKTMHLFDVVASKMPSLDQILDHLPASIEEVYFYFSPDRLTQDAVKEPYLYDKGHLMVYGALPCAKPFMIAPLSRC